MRLALASLATLAFAEVDIGMIESPSVAGFNAALLQNGALVGGGNTMTCIEDVIEMALELEMCIEDFTMSEYILIADGFKLLGFFLEDLGDALVQCADSTRSAEQTIETAEAVLGLAGDFMNPSYYGIDMEAQEYMIGGINLYDKITESTEYKAKKDYYHAGFALGEAALRVKNIKAQI